MAQLATTYEDEGYDGHWGDSTWWFEAWGTGPKAGWTVRGDIGRPPRPRELRTAQFIVIGVRRSNGETIYRTHNGGLDFDPSVSARRRGRR